MPALVGVANLYSGCVLRAAAFRAEREPARATSAPLHWNAAATSKRTGDLAGRWLRAEWIDVQPVDPGRAGELRREFGRQRHTTAHADLPVRTVGEQAARQPSGMLGHPLVSQQGDPGVETHPGEQLRRLL